MVERVGMSDAEIRATLVYLQAQITAIESFNAPTPLPASDKLLYYRNSIGQLDYLNIGTGLQINGTTLVCNVSGSGGSSNWSDLTGVPAPISALSGLSPAADKFAFYTGASTANLADVTSTGRSVLAAANTAAVLSLIGGQAADATLTALAGVTTASDTLIYATGVDTFTTTAFTSTARNLLDDGSTGAMRTTLGLVIGTDVQAYSATLAALAALTAPGADRIVFYDQSAGGYANLSLGTNISITGTTLNVSTGTATVGDGDYGDITVSGTGTVYTIDAGVVTLAKMANIATARFIGRTTAGTGVPEALTGTQATALLDAFVGDSGSGGTKGLVTAPTTGDATKFLKGDGTWASIPGGGDALTSGTLAQFAATTSAQLRGVLSDETGTGAAVFASSPLFAGTPTFPNDGLHLLDTDASHDLVLTPGSNLTADRVLTLITGDADRTLNISAASVTISSFMATVLDDADGATALATLGAQASDSDLAALAGISTTGFLARTGSGTAAARTLTGTSGEISITNGTGVSGDPVFSLDSDIKTRMIQFEFDGMGSAIAVNSKARAYVNFNCTITAATVGLDQSGSIVFDIWKDTHANYPPTVADTITASAKPTVSAATKAQDTTLTGWTKTIAAGSWLIANVDSISTATYAVLSLTVTTT